MQKCDSIMCIYLICVNENVHICIYASMRVNKVYILQFIKSDTCIKYQVF